MLEPILPPTITRYIAKHSGRHQLALAALSVTVFLLAAAPLELQRRIINNAIGEGALASIIWLAVGYVLVALAEGGCKLALNIYRGWVSEGAVRHLRRTIQTTACQDPNNPNPSVEGLEVAVVLSEVEPIGGFVGTSVSEPLLQGGILLTVFGYMAYLQPHIALASLLVFSPQLVFVPLMQQAINRRVESRVQVLRDVSGGILGSFGDHPDATAMQDKRIDIVFDLNMGIYRLKFTMNFLMNLVHHLGVGAVLAVGGWYAATGRTEVGTVVAFISGLVKVNDPWGDLVTWYRDAMVNGVKYRLVSEAADRLARSPAAAVHEADQR